MKVLINRFERKRIVRCKVCGSILLVSLSDCVKHECIDYTGYFNYECPLCKSNIRTKNFKRY